MPIRVYRPTSPGIRAKSTLYFTDLSNVKPVKSLTFGLRSSGGRNNRGVTTIRGRGGGHKRNYRKIDFMRRRAGVTWPHTISVVKTIEYDPNRNARICLIEGEKQPIWPSVLFPHSPLQTKKRYIICPRSMKIGQVIYEGSGGDVPIQIGNTMRLEKIPLGTRIHNINLTRRKGGQIVRAAGTSAKILAMQGKYVTLRLPSKEVRLVPRLSRATIGEVGNIDSKRIVIGKAGRNRWLGRRPKVRGVAQNPNDHPHGGGEGRSSIGRARPVTPWGKHTLGRRTRNQKKLSSKYILRRRPKRRRKK